MSFDQARNSLKPIANVAGLLLVIAAALKLGGMHFGIPGNVSECALVGIGLLHV